MRKKIVSVGFDIPNDEIEDVSLASDRSLLDADIVLVRPGIPHGTYYDNYQGKPCLSESDSFSAKECLAHWRKEIRAAFEAGKLVVVFLGKPYDVFVDSGRRETSGTGRNARVTRIVLPLKSYEMLPVEMTAIPASGTEMRPVKDLGVVASYWNAFGPASPYELYLDGQVGTPLLQTKHGNRVVASVLRKGNGMLMMVPPIDLELAGCIDSGSKGKSVWSKSAAAFGKRLASCLSALADAVRADTSITPQPDWAEHSSYRLAEETRIEQHIADVSKQVEVLQKEKATLKDRHRAAVGPRRLLYEGGKQLEHAILEALRCFGFKAEPYADAESEFDVVFTSEDGRFLGEAEGKDTKPLSIDKITQLERNLQEDFARDGVEDYAQGVLFGNAYRLSDPGTRDAYFTEKVLKSAARLGVALVRTPDMFIPVKYLLETGDASYAGECRKALLSAKGRVVIFPPPPVAMEPPSASVKEADLVKVDAAQPAVAADGPPARS